MPGETHPENLTGYALVNALREDAKDCARSDRASLLRNAAEEITNLIEELKKTQKKKD
jgi:hypothetical protein